MSADAYFEELAQRAAEHFPGQSLHLIGFSLGARVALELAARLGTAVTRIDLVSPAGPLDGSDHVDLMAGRTIYRMATRRKRLFQIHSAIQAWIARNRTRILYDALFSKSTGADDLLAKDPSFAQAMQAILRHCFADGGSGYRREVQAYVSPWSELPSQVRTPVTLWQGEADDWTPPPIARRLHSLLPHSELRLIPELAHYSTLSCALAEISGDEASAIEGTERPLPRRQFTQDIHDPVGQGQPGLEAPETAHVVGRGDGKAQ